MSHSKTKTMKLFNRFRNWTRTRVDRRVFYALLVALLIAVGVAAPALAQSGITFFGGLGVVSDGTAAAPQFTFFNDVDTGLYRAGANDLGITTGGSQVVDVNPTGVTVTGSLTAAGITNTGGSSNTAYGSISAPTAVASATPVLRLNSLGANNDLFDVEKASTPVFKIGNGGNVTLTGNLSVSGSLSQGASTQKCVGGQQSFIGSATVIPATLTAAGITTPFPAVMTINQGPNNNNGLLASTSSSGVVSMNAYQAILGATLTPVAATTTTAVTYYVCGQ